MLRLTIQSFLTGKFQEKVSDHFIYLFRDEATVLYIGQSVHILSRLRTHIETTSTQIGRLISANIPKSYTWQIELFTLQDCGMLPPLNLGHLNKAEQDMIMKFRPCLNVDFNPNPSPIPCSYNLPPSALPDYILCPSDTPKSAFSVYYYAYDWVTQRYRKYNSVIVASNFSECKNTAINYLGFLPDEFRYTQRRPHF